LGFQRAPSGGVQRRGCEGHRRGLGGRKEQVPAVAQVRTLLQLKGIGVNSSRLYVREAFGWRAIENRRRIGWNALV